MPVCPGAARSTLPNTLYPMPNLQNLVCIALKTPSNSITIGASTANVNGDLIIKALRPVHIKGWHQRVKNREFFSNTAKIERRVKAALGDGRETS